MMGEGEVKLNELRDALVKEGLRTAFSTEISSSSKVAQAKKKGKGKKEQKGEDGGDGGALIVEGGLTIRKVPVSIGAASSSSSSSSTASSAKRRRKHPSTGRGGKRGKGGRTHTLVLEGPICANYFKVRKILYERFVWV